MPGREGEGEVDGRDRGDSLVSGLYSRWSDLLLGEHTGRSSVLFGMCWV